MTLSRFKIKIESFIFVTQFPFGQEIRLQNIRLDHYQQRLGDSS